MDGGGDRLGGGASCLVWVLAYFLLLLMLLPCRVREELVPMVVGDSISVVLYLME